MDTVQEAPEARVAGATGQVVDCRMKPDPAGTLMLDMVKATGWLFVMVKDLGTEVWPTATDPQLRAVGDTLIPGTLTPQELSNRRGTRKSPRRMNSSLLPCSFVDRMGRAPPLKCLDGLRVIGVQEGRIRGEVHRPNNCCISQLGGVIPVM
jgi:hypothetical protein